MNTSLAPVGASSIETAERPAPRNRSYLVCCLFGITVGIEALAVQEITPLPAWTSVSGRAPLVAGVVDVRGQFVPLVDIAAAMGLPERAPHRGDVLVIVEQGGAVAAIAVHEVRDVQPLAPRNFEPGAAAPLAAPLEFDSAATEQYTSGLATLDHTVVQLLKLESILHPEGGRTYAALSLRQVPPDELAIFDERAQALAATAQTTAADETLELAVVMLQGERFGLELSAVREFAPLRAVTPVPRAPSHILGLINLRGETLPW